MRLLSRAETSINNDMITSVITSAVTSKTASQQLRVRKLCSFLVQYAQSFQ